MGFWTYTFYSFGLSLFVFFITFYEFIQYFSYYQLGNKYKISSSYDYLVVGSGTGGSTVALRLAEAGKSVLLLEAGVYGHFLYDIPAMGPLMQQSAVDWQYYTVPQKYACKALNNRRSYWPMGRIFGGTSRINNMIYLRGHRKDYTMWYLDKTDYDYNRDVFSYFKKSENQIGINDRDRYHCTDGLMYVNDLPFVTPLADAILKAAELLGWSERDLNGQSYTGFMKPQVNIKNGKRVTIADTILEKKHPNLHVLTGAHVFRILFKGYHEIFGLSYKHFGKIETAVAKRSIILSAGVIGTPKLLMLSGIGPEDHLHSMGIEVHQNLPVGNNLQDHITTGLDLIILNETLPINLGSMLSPSSAYKYFKDGVGPWTSSGCEVIGIPEPYSFNKSPKLQFMILPVGITSDGGKHLRHALNIRNDIWDSYFKPLVGKQTISILPVLLHPKSRGTLRLKNSNAYSAPIIDPKYLSNYEDVETLMEGIKLIGNIISTEPMKQLGAHLYTRHFPNCESYVFDSKDYWECYIQHLTITSYHPVGTCKMGHESDRTTVVDFNFKVKGVANLYIADASVMPTLPSGNINAAVAMIGERLADILLHNVTSSIAKLKHFDLFITKSTCDVFDNSEF